MSDGEPEENQHERPEIAGAIEFPTASRQVLLNQQQPRQPRSLQDLLRFATEARGAGAPGPSLQVQPMDEESKRFLNEYLSSLSVDVAAELKTNTGIIEKFIASEVYDEDECDEAFERILNLVDRIDFANDFYKLGGFRLFTPCLSSASTKLRWRCCELIAELCQNNPYCQSKCVEEGFLPKIASLIDQDSSEIVRIKALYAVSCLVRESKEALAEFTTKDGFSVLLRALQSESDKLKIKSSFLISSLCSQNPNVKGDLVSMGFVEQITGLIIQNKSEYTVVEHLLSALCSLVNDCPDAQEIGRRPDLQLQPILECIVEEAAGKEDAREVVEYAKTIEQLVFVSSDSSCFEEDR